MNAEREIHEDDDLTAQQLDEVYGDQASELGERAVEQEDDGEPVADDEQLDTDLIDKQLADTPEPGEAR